MRIYLFKHFHIYILVHNGIFINIYAGIKVFMAFNQSQRKSLHRVYTKCINYKKKMKLFLSKQGFNKEGWWLYVKQ